MIVRNYPDCRARASLSSVPSASCVVVFVYRSPVAGGHRCECPCGYRQRTLSTSYLYVHCVTRTQVPRLIVTPSTEVPLTSSQRNINSWGGRTCLIKRVCDTSLVFPVFRMQGLLTKTKAVELGNRLLLGLSNEPSTTIACS